MTPFLGSFVPLGTLYFDSGVVGGHWPLTPAQPAVYAIYCDGALMYLGETENLATRLYAGHMAASASAGSPAAHIREALAVGKAIAVSWLDPVVPVCGIEIDARKSIEGYLIATLNPPWNRTNKAARTEAAKREAGAAWRDPTFRAGAKARAKLAAQTTAIRRRRSGWGQPAAER